MNNIKKEIPTGTSDFKKLIEGNNLFIDKTLLIKDFIENNSEVLLIPRPRRFGKTLNLSMLKYFLDIKEDGRDLFEGFKISEDSNALKHMNQYPVISMTFKGISTKSWDDMIESLSSRLSSLYKDHKEEIWDILDEYDKEHYSTVLQGENKPLSITKISTSIAKLTKYLKKRYGKRVIVLIDEYDALMHEMYSKEELGDCVNLFRDIYGSALKDNTSLEKGLLTGILKVAKEGIFSGLNNVDVFTVLDKDFSKHFGFLEKEIKPLLIKEKINLEETKEWYNGYNFSENIVYNPWSILKLLKSKNHEVYWQNTGLGVQKLMLDALVNQRGLVDQYIKDLLENKSIVAKVQQGLILQDVRIDRDAFWSLMLYSGYLTKKEKISDFEYDLKIPNKEVKEFYVDLLKKLSLKIMGSNIMEELIKGNTEGFEKELNNNVLKDKSFRDSDESFYHGMIYAMSKTLQGFEVVSNVESGDGIMDIMLKGKELGIVIEVKKVYGKIEKDKIEEELEKRSKEALEQIKSKRYHERLNRGNIKLVGIAFKDKKCRVMAEDLLT